MSYLTLHTPLGELTVFETDGAIVALEFGRAQAPAGLPPPSALLREAAAQLQDYFDGQRTAFDLPLAPQGTPFRRQVWDALRRIPPGETRSYIDIAREIGCRSPRAIGQANGSNPIPILIPCHRVVAADGSLGGYSGGEGPATKRYLLALEARVRPAAGTGELALFPPSGGQRQGTPR
jgi:methylated-DNA-[protein]-cysteine S-methyltransferase